MTTYFVYFSHFKADVRLRLKSVKTESNTFSATEGVVTCDCQSRLTPPTILCPVGSFHRHLRLQDFHWSDLDRAGNGLVRGYCFPMTA